MNKKQRVDVGVAERPGMKEQEVTIRVLGRQVGRLTERCERLWRENRELRKALREKESEAAALGMQLMEWNEVMREEWNVEVDA